MKGASGSFARRDKISISVVSQKTMKTVARLEAGLTKRRSITLFIGTPKC